jgi:hypothetical protein
MHSGGGVQHPSYRFELKGEGDIVLADLNVRTSGIVLSEDIEGAVIVVDEGRAVVADVEKPRGSTVVVAVGPGRYDVTCRREGTARGTTVEVAVQGVTSVATRDLKALGTGGSTRAKGGDVPKDTYVGLTYSMGYSYTSFDQPNRQLVDEFGALSVVGLDAEPYVESSMLRGALGGEVWFSGRILANFEVCYASGSAEGSAQSSLVNPLDSIAYGYSLHWRSRAQLVTVAMGGGVRLWRGPLRRLGLRIGIDIQWVDIQLDATYDDGLYRLRETRNTHVDGLVVLPSVGLSYSVPLGRWFDAGVLVRYALQVNAQELSGDGFGAMKVDLGGFDARVFVSLDLGRGR